MSVKFQLVLPDPLAAELKREALRMKLPLAQWIRQAMEDQLRLRRTTSSRDAFAFLDDILIDESETDVAARVDEILYGTPRPR